ncbi:hypothetical protein MES4922_190480 [Mesorhizobium ventifaucium]|uniref:Uncharacterized protein n=1 Tax=Mesorhizobium ventifaucium TaxID=666020 RepID=A0ABM9DPH5_9HYPH|nr:hypothetical protein MES4922_190480 [Mesorhizobium ventifaucium]
MNVRIVLSEIDCYSGRCEAVQSERARLQVAPVSIFKAIQLHFEIEKCPPSR